MAARAEDMSTILFKTDHTTFGMHLYHKVNMALIGLGPIALVLSPSSFSFPMDLALGVLIPLHSHLGSNDVVSDYAKKVTKAAWFENGLRRGVFGMTVLTFLGLLKLNLQGPGISEGIKSLWRPRTTAQE